MNSMITSLILVATMLAGVTASASTSSIWADSVHSAAKVAESAKAHINRSDDCKGLNDILVLGAGGSGMEMPGTLGELRSELLELDLLAATVQFASALQSDASAQEGLTQISGYKSDVQRTLVTRLHFCGNGVEKEIAH